MISGRGADPPARFWGEPGLPGSRSVAAEPGGRSIRAPELFAGVRPDLPSRLRIGAASPCSSSAGEAGREAALAVGFMAAERNVGLMLAAAGGLLSDATWLYLASSQIPMHRSPILLGPRRARCRRTAGSTRAGPG